MSHGLRIVALTPDARTEQAWRELALRSGNVFATPDWAAAWSAHLGQGRPLLLGAVDLAGRLRGVLALEQVRERGLRVLRLCGHGPADELGPACAPQDRPAVVAALAAWLRDRGGWDLLMADALPGDVPWDLALGGVVTARESTPVLDLPAGGWEAFLAGRSRNLREQLRRRERRLRRAHDVRFRRTEDPAALAADLDTLVRLHHLRWGEPASGEGAFTPGRLALHRDFAARALAQGWLRLWFLEVDDAPVAAWYGLRFGAADVYYQAGRDPAFDREAVGFVLLAHSIRDATEAGQREYRFGLGDEPYKRRFATRDPGLCRVTVARGPAGRAALAAAPLRRHLLQMAKRRRTG